jgi:hypothetical protein
MDHERHLCAQYKEEYCPLYLLHEYISILEIERSLKLLSLVREELSDVSYHDAP